MGGVVSFPLAASDILDGSGNKNKNLKVPSRSDITDATLDAFAIPGYGEEYLNDLLEAGNEELEGLLLVSAKAVEDGDSIEGGNGATGGLSKVPAAADDVTTVNDAAEGNGDSSFTLANNIWAIAAVAALGATFLTILTCTTILWCDWRKRKARKERIKEQKLMKQQQQQQQGMMDPENGLVQNNGDNFYPIHIPTMPSEETNVTDNNPSRSNSDDYMHQNQTVAGNTAATARTSTRPSFMNTFRKKSTKQSLGTKSKAAVNHLQLSRSIDDEDPSEISPSKSSMDKAPSIVYSVGEDTTTMLYPAIHRGRQNSRDLSEFDGYSMDGMSIIGAGGTAGILDGNSIIGGGAGSGSVGTGAGNTNTGSRSGNKQHPLLQSRDFDSVWDDESKLTIDESGTSSPGGQHGHNLSIDSDPLFLSSLRVDKSTIINNLNRLDEDRDNNRVSTKNFLNEFDDENSQDDSEASSHQRGAFTMELLMGSGKSKGGRKSILDDDDSILGDIGGEVVGSANHSEYDMMDVSSEVDAPAEENASAVIVPSSEESVDSSPSWAGKIKSALVKSSSKAALDQMLNDDESSSSVGGGVGVAASGSAIFRTAKTNDATNCDDASASSSLPIETAPSRESQDQDSVIINNSILSHHTSPNSVKEKFVSSLGVSLSFSRNNDDDNNSVSSARSAKSSSSHQSNSSRSSRASKSKGGNNEKYSKDNALGLTNSMDEEVDEDPSDMIENINDMLTECRVILDTDVDGPAK